MLETTSATTARVALDAPPSPSVPFPSDVSTSNDIRDEQVPANANELLNLSATSSTTSTTLNGSSFFRRRHYLCPTLQQYCAGSVYLAFTSHGCFVIGALFYLRLSYIQLAWLQFALVDNDAPRYMIDEDDDSVWRAWASMYQGTYRGQYKTFQHARQEYYTDYAFYIFWGAGFYVLVGLLDYLRYWDTLNTYMILAGSAGMLSGSTKSRSMAIIWECVSLHLYLLGSFTLLGRDHNHRNVRESGNNDAGDYVGEHDHDDSNNNTLVAERWQSIFRTGDLLFLIGSILDVLGSYFGIAGAVGFWVAYTDVVACYLWLLCGLTEIAAELYFLRKQLSATNYYDEDYNGCWEIHCY